MVFRLCLLVLVISPINVKAHNNCNEHRKPAQDLVDKVSGCPHNKDLDTICSLVNSRTEEGTESLNSYYYQTKILNASCVKEADTPEIIKTKVQTFWKKFGKTLRCTDPSFTVQNGSIVKYAVSRSFDMFLFDVAKNWKVDLNYIDPSDQKTVLDFISQEIERNKGNALEAKLKSYYDLLKNNGAKHATDL